MTYKRNRLLYAMMTIIVIVLGLCSRKIAHVLPHILNTYLGDTLWALMIFISFGFIFKSVQTKVIALLAISFCYIIEFSQLYHAGWIDHIRETTLGGLILGYGFLWSDLLAYAIGIGIGVISEMLFVWIRKPSNLN
ncbi:MULTISPECIES: DUF2809 domain-containing protein [unclassified Bacillus (in: firmicutes)]|uniref:ribosomal maturation YjgA family protein n=1 Tax=unclassified Bacillus (in: firmicutes) TaxID=185979 RepID=UPI0008EF995E|nr:MULTISPECIES: DUF2809 domain-containing protein [unclassified Bacillus (in: firmicutes)]SFJ51418.1 Protein of unknown function [Bacillus sp. 71mf]SFT04982.1 Protein of unknown function [Bacillus sp. 103mf]